MVRLDDDHPFVPTCLPAGCRAQGRSMRAEGHRCRRRDASSTAPSTAACSLAGRDEGPQEPKRKRQLLSHVVGEVYNR